MPETQNPEITCLTVKELKEALERFDDNTLIFIKQHIYGSDHFDYPTPSVDMIETTFDGTSIPILVLRDQ